MRTPSARAQTVELAKAGNPIAWGAAVVSPIVLVGFLVMLWLVIREEVPTAQREMVTLLLGTPAGMAANVAGYWVGSSAGSMQKNAALEKVVTRQHLECLRSAEHAAKGIRRKPWTGSDSIGLEFAVGLGALRHLDRRGGT